MKDKNLITRFKMDNKNESNEEARRSEGQKIRNRTQSWLEKEAK